MKNHQTRIFSFYLPQFHPIPENDVWWGKGFTEWRNVSLSKPKFRDHHQPQIPSDLGFYDLRLKETHIEQAKMAKNSGIDGFCYYHYWFNGKTLLGSPLEIILNNKDIDISYMLCWANENWTRRWDGKDQEILIEQDYTKYDPSSHIEHLLPYFHDDRYAKIEGKPILVIYRANQISNLEGVIDKWNKECIDNGHLGIYLLSVSTSPSDDDHAIACGVDKIIDFQPSKNHPQRSLSWKFVSYIFREIASGDLSLKITRLLPTVQFAKIFNYKNLVSRKVNEEITGQYVPCVIPSWDNSARRQTDSTVIQNRDPKLFGAWLKHAIEMVSNRKVDERLVFINAWNEWAEGCHLEPDTLNGRRFLDEVKLTVDNMNEDD